MVCLIVLFCNFILCLCIDGLYCYYAGLTFALRVSDYLLVCLILLLCVFFVCCVIAFGLIGCVFCCFDHCVVVCLWLGDCGWLLVILFSCRGWIDCL